MFAIDASLFRHIAAITVAIDGLLVSLLDRLRVSNLIDENSLLLSSLADSSFQSQVL